MYVTLSFEKDKAYFKASSIEKMGDNMMAFAEGDGLNISNQKYDDLNKNKINLLQKYTVKLYLDSNNQLLYTWSSGQWSIRLYSSYGGGFYTGTQIYLPSLSGTINSVGCGAGSSAKKFRLEFTK